MSRGKIVYNPNKDYDLPDIDLLTLLFEHPLALAQEDTLLEVEAAHPSNHITKAQARIQVKRLAHQLRHVFGVGKDGPEKDVVVFMSSGQIFVPVVFWAVIAANGIFSSASPSFTPSELARQIKQGDSRLLIASVEHKDVAVKAAKETGIPLDRVLLLDSNGGKRMLKDVAGKHPNLLDDDGDASKTLDWEVITDRNVLEKRCICLLYTSGTTGLPKGVHMSHRNLVSEGILPQLQNRASLHRFQKQNPKFKFEYRTIGHLPTAHVAGLQGYLINPVISGGPVYWMPKFDFAKFLEYNKKFKITFFFTVPPIYLLIAKNPAVTDQFKTLFSCLTGAAPMGPELMAQVKAKTGCLVSQTWGLSESTGSFTTMPYGEHDETGSISQILPNHRMRIVGEDEQDVLDGDEGEFWIKGPAVSQGYYKNEKATRESWTEDGWFKTGDIGLRKEGKFYIVDRKKELIKYKGLQVAPAELEALLVSHSLISDAAVIGVPDPSGSGNELPRAYVVADKSKISEQQIKDHIKTNLSQHKQLRGGVVWLDAIPKSASGKILRRELRDMAKREKEQQEKKARL